MIDPKVCARALGGEVRGQEILAPGPGHSAADRSLSVKLDADAPDGFVVNSFAGDDPIACRDYVREKAGLEPFKPSGQRLNNDRRKGKIVAEYDYPDENGTRLYQVVRYDPKDFRLRRPDGNGEWIWNLGNTRRVLYRLPELLQFPYGTVFVCEGEKDADRVASLGHCATTVASGKWTGDCAKALAGRDIIILQDNDEPGAEKALASAHALHGFAKTIRIVLLPDLPDHGDVSNWLDADPQRADKFVETCFDAAVWTPGDRDQAGDDQHEAKAHSTLSSARASSFQMKGISWLWPNRFALGKLGLLVGLPDEGKGQVFCDMAARVTHGQEWPCNEGRAPKGNVILLTAEDDIGDTIVPRLVAAGADLDRVEIVKMVRENKKDRMFSLVTDLELLRQKIKDVGDVKLVQIDPITAYLGNNKIDSFRTTDVRAVLGPVVELAAELNVAIVGIMHFNKKIDVNNALLRISDSLAFGATARHVYAVVEDAENDRKLLVKAKNNLAASGNKSLAYRFGGREVGVDAKTGQTIFAPHILWEDHHVDVTAAEAMEAATTKSAGARDEAKIFLTDILANGPVLKTEIEEAAEANGIAGRTLFRAKKDLNIEVDKDRKKDGKWYWRLPEVPKAATA
jgi:putative DNA primase/helicase